MKKYPFVVQMLLLSILISCSKHDIEQKSLKTNNLEDSFQMFETHNKDSLLHYWSQTQNGNGGYTQ